MSLSISDARVFSAALKKARQKRKLTQAECAELLDHSVSFQKDLERGRCSPSIEGFYHICRTLGISADDCIFQDGADRTGSTYQTLPAAPVVQRKEPVRSRGCCSCTYRC